MTTHELLAETKVTREKLEAYLSRLHGAPAKLIATEPLGRSKADTAAKGFGYGKPLRLDYELAGGERRRAVLHTMRAGPFGHERMPDRARTLLWEHSAFGKLPRHIRSLDAAAILESGDVISLAGLEEVCTLTEYAEGEPYFLDLERIKESGIAGAQDLARADALCDYLAEIHAVKGNDPGLYTRRVRELVGSGECIMGLIDNYPENAVLTPAILEEIERLSIAWRWKLKPRTHRLSQIHGDFHPWNILFGSGDEFHLLDRSRGEYGDPADDLAALTINYLFFALRCSGRLEGAFEILFLRFWNRYLHKTGDHEILDVAAPYFVFRGLVLASPRWYPNIGEPVRKQLLNFMLAVLHEPKFDPAQVNRYCGV
jgi:hypothetical protein